MNGAASGKRERREAGGEDVQAEFCLYFLQAPAPFSKFVRPAFWPNAA
jgi:hypothetical protein